VRLFVAIDIPEAVRRALGELIARLRTESKGAKWVRPEAMHVTLKFIGEVEPAKVDAIRAALRAVHSERDVEMNFRGLGFFPNERRPRVLWCGIAASPNLAMLAADVDGALKPLDIPAESRDFVPHLTLARFSVDRGGPGAPDKLVCAADEMKSYDFGSTRETEFHLIHSQLKPSGAEYTRLESFPIVKSKN
jgi:2'-5' RNA ligase